MKIKVSFTVEIDPSVWTLNYGIEGAEDIRADVRTYLEETALNQLDAVGVLMPKKGFCS